MTWLIIAYIILYAIGAWTLAESWDETLQEAMSIIDLNQHTKEWIAKRLLIVFAMMSPVAFPVLALYTIRIFLFE